ncbi:hypothetical protein [Alicyclobacillus ferrooxydans]|uniref:MFS transporter n=1 Tax=Alicyclobacillus ferrooxydans TaxID=471514 RepID=A0A0P9CLT2_9BACL|nr:hypothetical protein [Alicyclobacillus ferrooxydans]KPV43950.1 hypothetical protein AN477_09505 [Alicyclobacillus ferrooxydans]
MSPQLKRLLTFNMGYAIIYNYINIFVNFYIWQQTKSFSDICLFNFVLFLVVGANAIIGYAVLLRTSTRFNSLLSVVFAVIGFVVLMLYHPANHVWLILSVGVPMGLFVSYFWTAGNISISKQGQSEDFAIYWSYSNTFTQVISVVNPLLSALFIFLFGFVGSFVIMTIFIGFMIYVSFLVPKIVLHKEFQVQGFLRRATYKSVFTSKKAHWLYASMSVGVIYAQLQNIFALLFTFQVTNKTLVVASLSAGYALVTIGSFLAYLKLHFSPSTWLKFAIVLNAIGIFLDLFHLPVFYILSNFLTTIGIFYFNTIWTAQQFAVTADISLEERIRYFLWREVNLDMTRSLFLLLLIFVPVLHRHFIDMFILVLILSGCFIFMDRKMNAKDSVSSDVAHSI